ncbi:MAG: (2Fe-2S) ferredoxin domain-containing protein [Clostridiales bacterium]|nr:(2Fe-2S) ferredoxin domain-containing protein [Clostridiales bacterium]
MDLMVCVGSSCHLQNSREIIGRFKELIASHGLEDRVILKGSFCMGHCADEGVCVKYGDQVFGVTVSNIDDFFETQIAGGLES